jgi:hypothetical protein
MMVGAEAALVDSEAMIERLDAPAAATARSLRHRLLAELPDAGEQPDESGNVIGYGFGSGYKGLVCTIILSKSGVKLGIPHGATLPDPDRLLAGTGKVHRYVVIDDQKAASDPRLSPLLAEARAAALARFGGGPISAAS